MSKNWKQEPELQLMDVSQDCTSIAHKRHTPHWIQSTTPFASDWNDNNWSENIVGDEFIDLDDLVDSSLDNDIIDFNIDEY